MSSTSSNRRNSCCICFESLGAADEPVCATIPCGHVFHSKCFQGWKKSRRGGPCKCPVCNAITASSVRLFVNLFREHDEHDSVTLSSASTNDCQNQDEHKDRMLSPSGVMERGPPGVIELFDDDERPLGKQKSDLMRKKAKRLKKRVRELEQQRDELFEKEKKHATDHTILQHRLEQINEEFSKLQESSKIFQRSLDHAKVDLEREKLARVRAQESIVHADERAKIAEEQVKAIQDNHANKLQEVQRQTMAEVNNVCTQHRDLVEENRRLKDQLFKVTERYHIELTKWKNQGHQRSDDLEHGKLETVQRARDIAKLWMTNARNSSAQDERQAASLEALTRTHVRNATKMSGQAARISLAAMKVAQQHSTVRLSTLSIPQQEEKEHPISTGSLLASSLSVVKKKRTRAYLEGASLNEVTKVRRPQPSKTPRQTWGSLKRL